MPVIDSDIKFYRAASQLGGAITANEIPDAVMGNLFPRVLSAEAATGVTKYACFYVKNENDTDTLDAAIAFISANTPSNDTEVQIGLGSSGVSGEEQAIADDETAPTGVVFSLAPDAASGLDLTTLAGDEFHAIWVRLTVDAGTGYVAQDGWTIRVEGEAI